MAELVITRGLPASGKSTWARAWVQEDPAGRARVNRDDLRANLYGRPGWSTGRRWRSGSLSRPRSGRCCGPVVRWWSTICICGPGTCPGWVQLATETGAAFVVQDFTSVPVDECVRRDAQRGARGERSVGEEVIRQFHARFLASGKPLPLPARSVPRSSSPVYRPDPGLPGAWLVDVDGTVAQMSGEPGARGPYDWHRVAEDAPNPAVIELVRALATTSSIVVMSGRDESCRALTQTWLEANGVPHQALIMRRAGDNRKDSIVKRELFDQYVAPHWAVRGVIDDRRQVVEMWRAIGLTCAQVAPGDF